MTSEEIYLKFAGKRFDDNDLINLLLPYMSKNGVKIIEEDDLARKLYSYYKNPKFEPLFRDIELNRMDDSVNIHNAIEKQKYFGNCICWVDNSKQLHLCYGNDYNTTYFEKDLDSNTISLIKEIANDFAIRNKIEISSRNRMNFYGIDPNTKYTVVKGYRYSHLYEWSLITDGDIKNITEIPYNDAEYFKDPNEPSNLMTFRSYNANIVELQNASYAVLRGKNDHQVRRLYLYSLLSDLNQLKKINDISNKIYTESEHQLVKGIPYIKKIEIK